MKKNIKIHSLILLLIVLASCANNRPEGKYLLNVIDDKNLIIDKPNDKYFDANTVLKFHCNPISDANLGMYVNEELVSIQNVVTVDDKYIWEYSFSMPKVDTTIKFDIVGQYYLRELFDWSSTITLENVTSVTIENGYIGTAPDCSVISNESSDDVRDITSNINYLNSTFVSEGKCDLVGGRYTSLTFNLKDVSYAIRINNHYVFVNDKEYKILLINYLRLIILDSKY